MRIRPCGPTALLVEVDDLGQVQALHAELSARRADGRLAAVTEIVPAARTVLLDGVADARAVSAEISSWTLTPLSGAAMDDRSGRVVEIPTVYDGEDLAWVAEQWRVSVAEAIAIHSGTELRAAFCGFAPGFAYLVGLPPRCRVARRPSPRPRVPAGAVGVAGEFTAVYPSASPGGWRLIGRTAVSMWDASRSEPALVAPGRWVRFLPVGP